MKAEKTDLENCWLLEPNILEDSRGYFFEGFNSARFKDLTGLEFEVKQINQSLSNYGVLRGLHYQTSPMAQAKLVSCIEGELLDVAVDLRQKSPTFGKCFTTRLSEDNKKQLFIPKGMAHGFLVLSKSARLMYLVDELYSSEHDTGISYDDPDLDISWGIDKQDIILSEKDRNLPTMKTCKNLF